MLFLRDGERMLDNNNSGSMKSPRLSEIITGRTTALTFKVMVVQATLEQYQASTQDGGNCSRRMENSLSTRKERYWMFLEVSMPRIETFLSNQEMVKYIKDGRSYTLMSIQMSQRRESLTRNSVSMLREISTLSLN